MVPGVPVALRRAEEVQLASGVQPECANEAASACDQERWSGKVTLTSGQCEEKNQIHKPEIKGPRQDAQGAVEGWAREVGCSEPCCPAG